MEARVDILPATIEVHDDILTATIGANLGILPSWELMRTLSYPIHHKAHEYILPATIAAHLAIISANIGAPRNFLLAIVEAHDHICNAA